MLDKFLLLFTSLVAAFESIAKSLAVLAAAASPTSPDVSGTELPPTGAPTGTAAAGKGRGKAADKTAGTPAGAASAATTPAAAASGTTSVDPTTLPEYQPLKEAVIALVNSGAPGKAEAINLLAKFHAKKASDVPVEKWPELLALFQKSLAVVNGEGDFA